MPMPITGRGLFAPNSKLLCRRSSRRGTQFLFRFSLNRVAFYSNGHSASSVEEPLTSSDGGLNHLPGTSSRTRFQTFGQVVPQNATRQDVSMSRKTSQEPSLGEVVNEDALRELQEKHVSSTFHPLWLRDACPCPQCVDVSSGQKNFQSADLPLDLDIAAASRDANANLVVRWTKDAPGYDADHVSTYSKSYLDKYAAQSLIPVSEEPVTWNAAEMRKGVKFYNYNDYMQDDGILLDALREYFRTGLLFLRDVPDSETSVENIGGRIGLLRDSFYGRTWNVRSEKQAINVAYTNKYLGFHMDLLYMTNPPALQMLHSLRSQAEGGASMFTDALLAANKLARDDLAAYEALEEQLVAWHYENNGQSYLQLRPTIRSHPRREPSDTPRVREIYWSPPFQSPFALHSAKYEDGRAARMTRWFDAAAKFNKIIEDPENIYEYRMNEGDCVIFDNRRILHARREFDITTGDRWLKGAYLDGETVTSRYRVLQESLA